MFDLATNAEQDQIREAVRSMLAKECPSEVVRASESSGHDVKVWARCTQMGLLDMSVLEGSFLDLALVAEQLGEFLAPDPLLDSAVAARLLSRIGETALVAAARGGRMVLTLAPRPAVAGMLLATPSGAVAQHVVFLDDRRLYITADPVPDAATANLGGLAIADRNTGGARELCSGTEALELYRTALAERKSLVAAQLVGAGRKALRLGIDYAGEREAFGVKVASFQAIAHRLADVATALDAAQLLSREAAWAHQVRPADAPALSSMALILAAEAAANATRESLHVFGGYGFMLEYDIQLYFRRVKAMTLVMGDIRREPELLADLLWSGCGS